VVAPDKACREGGTEGGTEGGREEGTEGGTEGGREGRRIRGGKRQGESRKGTGVGKALSVLTTRKDGAGHVSLPPFQPFTPPYFSGGKEGGRGGGGDAAAVPGVDPPFPPAVVDVNDLGRGGWREGGREGSPGENKFAGDVQEHFLPSRPSDLPSLPPSLPPSFLTSTQ